MKSFKSVLIHFLRVFSICGLFFLHIKINCVLVFLDGTSRSGKSSICKIVNNQDKWGVVAPSYRDWAQTDLAQLFPEEFTLIQSALSKDNIIHALRRNIVFFKK